MYVFSVQRLDGLRFIGSRFIVLFVIGSLVYGVSTMRHCSVGTYTPDYQLTSCTVGPYTIEQLVCCTVSPLVLLVWTEV